MADVYGWQVLDANESVVYDHTVIMSRKLGSYDIPVLAGGGSNTNWSHRIANIPFDGGTPFCHLTLRNNAFVASGSNRFMVFHPQIVVGSNYIDLSYNARCLSFSDDIAGNIYFGGFTVHYGVYNA